MHSKNFVEFAKHWKTHLEHINRGTGNVRTNYNVETEDPKEKFTNDSQFVTDIQTSLDEAKVFEIGKGEKKLLSLTTAPLKNDELHLPYPSIFLDVEFTKEELEEYGCISKEAERVSGILVRLKKLAIDTEKNIIGACVRFSMMSEINIGKDNHEVWWDTFTENVNLDEEHQDKFVNGIVPTTDKNIKKFVHQFVINFLNFVNNPDVEYVEHRRSDKNIQRRLKAGKPVIPSSFKVRISGKLKQYIDDAMRGEGWTYGYRFWVRGHYRQLSSDKYSQKKRIWILPYVKGKGVLVDKSYEVKMKE